MRKRLQAIVLLLLALLLCMPPLPQSAAAEGVFRLHVIANSDSAADQAAKLAVRDAILAYERERMAGAEDAAQARARLMADGAGLLAAVEEALAGAGMDYGASLSVGDFAFPARTYADKTYPAGEYAALRVILGAGAGENWWCVMFPPLCILELPDGEIGYEELRTNSYLIKLLKRIDGGKLWQTIREKLRGSSS